MKEVYLISQASGYDDTYYSHPIAIALTEEKAKEVCAGLDGAIAKNPFESQEAESAFWDLMSEWEDIESTLCECDPLYKNEYETNEPGYGNNPLYRERQGVIEKDLEERRARWMEGRGVDPSLYYKADAWQNEQYNPTYPATYNKIPVYE